MISKYFISAVLSFSFLACTNHPKEYQLKVKLQTLTAQDIFNKEMVSDVVFDSEEMNIDSLKTESKKLFLLAMDNYKNKNKVQEAIDLLVSSILIFPEPKSYYELGNALLDLSDNSAMNISDALKSYEVAQELNFQPVSNIYYQKACAHNMLYDMYNSGKKNVEFSYYDITNNLSSAFFNGFSDTASLKKDKHISSFTSTPEYREVISKWAARNLRDTVNNLFTQFSRSFSPVNGRFEITVENVQMKEHEESINYDFARFVPEMQNTSFGRDVSHEYFYVGKLPETSQYTALIYCSINFYGEWMQPVNTTLTTYDKEGEIIARKIIACNCSSEKVKSCIIENNIIEISEYKRIWQSPIDQVSFDDNKIKTHELISKATFIIADDGKIIDKNVPKNFQDSTVSASL